MTSNFNTNPNFLRSTRCSYRETTKRKSLHSQLFILTFSTLPVKTFLSDNRCLGQSLPTFSQLVFIAWNGGNIVLLSSFYEPTLRHFVLYFCDFSSLLYFVVNIYQLSLLENTRTVYDNWGVYWTWPLKIKPSVWFLRVVPLTNFWSNIHFELFLFTLIPACLAVEISGPVLQRIERVLSFGPRSRENIRIKSLLASLRRRKSTPVPPPATWATTIRQR